jgi:nickel-dependent lactate racemase
MRIAMDFAHERLEVEIDDHRVIAGRPSLVPVLADPVAAIRDALEQPFQFPPLRKAVTPDDHVTVVVDEQLLNVGRLLVPVLEHLAAAGISPNAVTLLCAPTGSRQEWLEDLPDAFEDVHLEIHDPTDRKRLSYLATMKEGRRLYMNRTLVDADQVVVLCGRRYDTLLGYAGAEGSFYPALSDEATRKEWDSKPTLSVPGEEPWPLRQEALETAWLLGLPFFVQLIAAPGDSVAHVVAGAAASSVEGQRLLDACWRRTVPQLADVVVASLSGDPARHQFADLAAAAANAARVVQPDGRILLLTRAKPNLGPGSEIICNAEEPRQAFERLEKLPRSSSLVPALQWAQAATRARISLLSDLPDETVEDLFAAPLEKASLVQRWLDRGGSCLFLDDAHKALAVVEPDEPAG